MGTLTASHICICIYLYIIIWRRWSNLVALPVRRRWPIFFCTAVSFSAREVIQKLYEFCRTDVVVPRCFVCGGRRCLWPDWPYSRLSCFVFGVQATDETKARLLSFGLRLSKGSGSVCVASCLSSSTRVYLRVPVDLSPYICRNMVPLCFPTPIVLAS